MKPLLYALLTCLAMPVVATEPSLPVDGLVKRELKDSGVTVYYAAKQATPLAKAPAWIKEYDEAGVSASAPVRLTLPAPIGAVVLVCDSGPSGDPSCYLLRDAEKPESRVFESPGTAFAFLPDGRLFVAGHTDNFYDHRRLFTFEGGKFVETQQPLRYAGVDAKAKVPIALYADRTATAKPTLTLAAGTAFTILLNDNTTTNEDGANPDYLVRTREGIVGWARLPGHPDGSTDAEGLFYRGD